jgi:hypothetical protein
VGQLVAFLKLAVSVARTDMRGHSGSGPYLFSTGGTLLLNYLKKGGKALLLGCAAHFRLKRK